MGPRRHDVAMRGLFIFFCFILAFPVQAAKQSATPNRFGAIAYHRATQSWGVSFSTPRARDANVEALRQCGHPQCEVIHKFKNGCAALADGPKVPVAMSGATRNEAETKTLRRCSEKNGGKDCTPIIAWACTK